MGFTAERNLLLSESQNKYGRYKALANPYPEVSRIAESLAKVDYGTTSQIQLPASEEEVPLGQDGWDFYFKTNIDLAARG